MAWNFLPAGKDFLLNYHTGEEALIALICFLIAYRAYQAIHTRGTPTDRERKSRIFLVCSSFLLLGVNSLIHAIIHAAELDTNLLYQTLLGYCLGLLTLVLAIAAEKPWTKKTFPLLYLPLLVLLVPGIYEKFPIFTEFRPVVWISVAYLSGLVCMLHIATFYRTKNQRMLWSALGFLFICISSIFLFFPAAIGSTIWLHGHIFRPIGFMILLFSMRRKDFTVLGGSMLYRALAAFGLLAAIPLLIFGTVVFYENIRPIDIEGRRLLVFLVLLVTFASALIFGLGMAIRLIRPILLLTKSVDRLVDEGFNKQLETNSTNEIGELSKAFNGMITKLEHATDEQERLCRLAATGELAATLAHEIKNPLNAIGVAAGYIGKNYKGRLIEEFVKVISDEVSRINRITTTLLDFACPVKPEPVPNDINKLVRETVSLLSMEAKEQGIELAASLEENIPLVSCDYNQIKQVLINLLINSYDAIDRAGTVSIATRRDNEKIMISVTDSGKGIPAEQIKHIFNPFFTTKTRGTGLGLAISKKIARAHNGDLFIAKTSEKGSVFTLVLLGEH